MTELQLLEQRNRVEEIRGKLGRLKLMDYDRARFSINKSNNY